MSELLLQGVQPREDGGWTRVGVEDIRNDWIWGYTLEVGLAGIL